MFDQRHLRAFVAVARTGSITGAALQLGYSQPAVSHQLKEIEKHIGAPLFDHAAIPLRLTAAGIERLAIAEVMLMLGQQLRKGSPSAAAQQPAATAQSATQSAGPSATARSAARPARPAARHVTPMRSTA